jgi:ABC-2 type transport system permease protein
MTAVADRELQPLDTVDLAAVLRTTTAGAAAGAVTGASIRPGPLASSPLQASVAFGWRAVRRIRHVPMQLFDVTMFPIMFTLLFTYLFGGALAGSPRVYLQQLLPGILVMTVAMITPYTGMNLNMDIQKGVFDRFRSMPIWGPAAMVGALLGDLVRYTLAAVITMVLGIVLGFRPDGGPLGVVAAVALLLVFSFSLSWIWTLLAMRLPTPDSVMQVSMMILFPLTFASNVFVDPATMPGWVQAFVDVNPVSQLTTAARSLMHGNPDGSSVLVVLASSVVLVAVFAPLTMRRYRAER